MDDSEYIDELIDEIDRLTAELNLYQGALEKVRTEVDCDWYGVAVVSYISHYEGGIGHHLSVKDYIASVFATVSKGQSDGD